MKTKAEIVQRLLDEKKIDAEEAVVLLMSDAVQQPFILPMFPQPVHPLYPQYPMWPFQTYCPIHA